MNRANSLGGKSVPIRDKCPTVPGLAGPDKENRSFKRPLESCSAAIIVTQASPFGAVQG
jgi:hypothetical protein